LTPSFATAYSVLPSVPTSSEFPATRETNRLPCATSKTIVGEMRESAQVTIAANGIWVLAIRSPTGE
jgi:hypothetical protein